MHARVHVCRDWRASQRGLPPPSPWGEQWQINVKQTAFDLNVPYTTLWSRFLNIHKPTQEAHASQQFLSPSQERLLIEWIEHLGLTGCPLCKWTIWIQAQHLCLDNKHPSKNWIYSFLKWHPNIVLSLASGLDPKHAKAFNCPVVNWYFDEFKELVESHGIPIKNIYNMDEKGCQRGGGKKTSCRKYLYSWRQRAKYKHHSANLELITIIEAICTDGTELKPGFIFLGTSFSPEWFDCHPDIVYVYYYYYYLLQVFIDSSVLLHLKTVGQMTLLVQSGLRNHLFSRLQHKTNQENQFSLFLMVMALMKLLKSFIWLNSIISLSCVFHLILLTCYSFLMLGSLDHSSVLGWIAVIPLWNLLV